MPQSLGPNIIQDGLVLRLDAADRRSYPGSGTTWNDVSGYGFNSTLINGPTFSNNNLGLIVLDGTNDWVSIPGNTTIYSSNFTWQSFHYIRSVAGNNLEGMWWSEAGTKNFLMGYRNTEFASTYFRIDTSSSVYASSVTGTQTNGFGSTAGPAVGRWILTTVVKSGNTFYLYWNNAILMWTVTISNWSIGNTSQAIAFGARADASYPNAMNIANISMYNRDLSIAEIQNNYTQYKTRFNL